MVGAFPKPSCGRRFKPIHSTLSIVAFCPCEKAKRYAAQKKELLKRKKAEESKKRTHRLCQVGGAVESVLGAPIEEEDIPKLIGFLKKQEANGKFFSKAMQKETHTDMEEV